MNDPRLNDIVEMAPDSPHYRDWIGAHLRIVALRASPDGEVWVSVVEGPQRHRGNGVYEGETSDIPASWLNLVERAASDLHAPTLERACAIARDLKTEEEAAASTTSYGERYGHTCAAEAAEEVAIRIENMAAEEREANTGRKEV